MRKPVTTGVDNPVAWSGGVLSSGAEHLTLMTATAAARRKLRMRIMRFPASNFGSFSLKHANG
jgi:hypothetical protein